MPARGGNPGRRAGGSTIYYHAGSDRYRLQNKHGVSAAYRLYSLFF